MRKLILTTLAFFVLLILPLISLLPVGAQTITPPDERVAYDLPHPGMLPDNPFFFIKQIRDQVDIMIEDDKLQKAQTCLEHSDKHIAMAEELTEKAKRKVTLETLIKAEQKFLEIPAILAPNEGEQVTLPKAFVDELEKSNKKHREVIEQIMRDIPEGDESVMFRDVLKLNDQAKKEVQELKKRV